MGMKVPYGEVDFKKIREEGYIYIDKTMYIEKLEFNSKLVYTRPRRFGKSLLTSMLNYYYSLDMSDQFEKLFKGLYIYDHPTPGKNKYYVMQFNFSGMEAGIESTLEEISKQFADIVYSGISKFISRYDLGIEVNQNNTAAGILRECLTKFISLKKENQIYIMIDEYDHFTNGMLQGHAEKFLKILGDTGFVRAFYEVIKENLETANPPVAKFFATGVAPVTLDSLTSGFNIATKISNNPLFTAMCGLTDDEVKQAIQMSGVPNQEETFNKMKENYDGYRFDKYSDLHVFNTTLVMYYLRDLSQLGRPPENLVDGNLAATGSKIENIAGLINREENYKILNELLMNGEVEGNIVENFELNNHFDRNDFLSMLFYNGYITIKDIGVRLKLCVPNYVTEILYSSYFLKLTEQHDAYKIDTTEIEESMQELATEGKIDKLTAKVQEFLFHCSPRDKENFNELNLKHVFSMLLAFTSQFMTYGEFQAGQGFMDLYIQKAANSLAKYEAVVELKYLKEKDAKWANMKKLSKEAKEQLEKYLQDKRLANKENLKKFVVIFKGFESYYIEEILPRGRS